MEIELAWGLHDLENFESAMVSHSYKRKKETKALQEVLNICDREGVPITFDIVGHLFLQSCSGNHHGPHPEGWFDRDPKSELGSDPHYYAPDLIEMIQNSNVEHEICTHTFSHIPCEELPNDVVDWELKKVRKIHDNELNEDLVSLVPPRHSAPDKDVLKKNGIEIIREPVDRSSPSTKLHTLWRDLFEKHPVKKPEIVDGVVETYSTLKGSLNANHMPNGEQPPHIIYQLLPMSVRSYIHRRYLNDAVTRVARTNSFGHLWSHLHDMANQPQLETFRWLIKEVSKHKKRGEIQVLTMRNLNSMVREYA